MATPPIIIFNNSTDYDAVLVATKLLFSDIIATKHCGCNSTSLCKTLGYIYAADYQASKETPNTIKYQEAVKAAYLSLSCISC